jgi:hypothetical protein
VLWDDVAVGGGGFYGNPSVVAIEIKQAAASAGSIPMRRPNMGALLQL